MILAIISAVIIGISLGVFGSGGSILTLPVLINIVGLDGKIAIASSLLIVAGITLVSTSLNIKNKAIAWQPALAFAVSGAPGAFIGALIGNLVSTDVQLSIFALLILIAARSMWHCPPEMQKQRNYLWLLLAGFTVGLVTGFVGVGGGFLLVPALLSFAALPLNKAVAASQLVIAINAISGFSKYHMEIEQGQFPWFTIALFIAIGCVGNITGKKIAGLVPAQKLRRGFALFLILVSISVFIQHMPVTMA